MTTLEILLLIISLLLLALYVTSKMGKNQSLNEIIKEVKQDLKETAENVYDLVSKAKDVIFDESIQKRSKNLL